MKQLKINSDQVSEEKRKNFLDKMALPSAMFILLSGCLTPIDIETEKVGGGMVISGQVSTFNDRTFVDVGTLADTDRLPIPYSGASVTLHDDLGNTYYFSEYFRIPGRYTLDFAGTPGRTYFIKVLALSGVEYESTPEKIPDAVGTDTIYYEFVNEEIIDREGANVVEPFVKLYAESVLPEVNKPLFIKWETEETYVIVPTDFPDPWGNVVPPNCYITQLAEPQKIVLHNTTEFQTLHIKDLLLARRLVDKSFYTRHYFSVYQTSLTNEAYEYLRKVNILANQVGSIFDSPPAEITGNIRNSSNSGEKVVGYFQAVHQSLFRVDILAEDVPVRFSEYCEFSPFRLFNTYPSECVDCLTARNSSHLIPVWWGD